MEDMLCIQATTLDELIEAIETSGRITVRIQKTPQDADEYVIAKSTLVKIADEVRAIEGTIEKIPGAELAARIRALQQTLITIKLATPVIALYDENGKIEPEYDTTAILGNAILGYAILGNGGNTVKLDTPVIYLYDDGVEDETVIEKLATPVIYLYEDTDEEPEVTILKLATPVIELVVENETEDDGGEVEPTIIQLDTPIIYLEEVTDDSEEDEPEVTIIQLATPVIELYEETVEPEEPAVTVIQLVTPVIYLEEIKEDIPDEPTIVQLDTPVIYLEVIEEEEEEPDVPDGVVKMTYNSSGYIDSNGNFFEPSLEELKYSQLIYLYSLANGSDGWCVWSEFSSPTEIKIFYYDDDNKLVGTLGYEDYLSRGLTAEFIVGYAANNYPTATQAIFTLDTSANDAVDAIYVYEVEEEEEYKLATPVIELVVA